MHLLYISGPVSNDVVEICALLLQDDESLIREKVVECIFYFFQIVLPRIPDVMLILNIPELFSVSCYTFFPESFWILAALVMVVVFFFFVITLLRSLSV